MKIDAISIPKRALNRNYICIGLNAVSYGFSYNIHLRNMASFGYIYISQFY